MQRSSCLSGLVRFSGKKTALHAFGRMFLILRENRGEMGEEAKAINLPIIDLTSPARRSTAASIRQACIESGFFYIVNHGVEKDLLEKLFDESRKFFLLSVEDKMKLPRKEDRGYATLYAEKSDPTSPTEGDPKETFTIGPLYDEVRDLNQWPSEELFPSWRSTIENYHQKILSAAKSLLKLIALALELEDEMFFVKAKDSPIAFLRLLHYPGDASCSSEEILGASAHSDYGMVTLLATDGVPGLQVCRDKDLHPRVWEDVRHIEGAFIVNIGDLMERWTNGLFRSTLHRVNPKGKERYSAAFFCDPPMDTVVECLESCCNESNPPRFAPILTDDYYRERNKLAYGA